MESNGGTLEDVDPELQLILRRAAFIGQREGEAPTVSFTSVWLAFLTGEDETSRFVQATARMLDVKIERVVEHWKTRGGPARFTAAMLEHLRDPSATPDQPLEHTPSAEGLMRGARALAKEVSPRAPVSGRHLLAACIYRPTGHLDDYVAWRLEPSAWSGFLVEHALVHHVHEAQAWLEMAGRESRMPHPSQGVAEVSRWTGLYADHMRAPADASALFAGILIDGVLHAREPVASAWLAKALGRDALELLDIKTLPPSSKGLTAPVFTIDASAALARAEGIRAVLNPEDEQLRVRHIIGALLGRPLPALAIKVLAKAGVSPNALCERFLEGLEPFSTQPQMKMWKRILGRPERTIDSFQLAGYDNDSAIGDDRLGIVREAHGLAAVVSSTQLTPPLSVGLFGDWGSGKSFFMHHMRKRIDLLAARSRDAKKENKPTAYCEEVIQIEFNAWHYVDGKLWASLVTHIFDELNAKLNAKHKPTVQQYAAQLASVQDRIKELQREREVLVQTATTLDTKLRQQRQERESRQLSVAEVAVEIASGKDAATKQQLDGAAKRLGLPEATLSLDAALAEKAQLEHVIGRVIAWWNIVQTRPALLAIAAVLVVLPFVALLPVFSGIEKAFAAITGVVTSWIAISKWARVQVMPAVTFIDQAIARAAEVETSIRARLSEKEQALQEERATLAAAEAKLQQEQLSLTERQAAIDAELKGLQDGSGFKRFVLERSASDDYRKELGLIASVHRDFSALSAKLGDSTEPHVDRIVLYIDDLDRCPPDRVVEVLQAVHLMLSMPLFVVVVAVDSRWLLQSLDAYYHKQFRRSSSAWQSKPQHYLEKIFQIPYTIPPMNADGFGDLIGSLFDRHLPKEQAVPPGGRAALQGDAVASQSDRYAPHRGAASQDHPAVRRTSASDATAAALEEEGLAHENARGPRDAHELPVNLSPRNLEITQAELDFAKTLAPLIPSPRAAKRLVNLYRIIRAGLSDQELEAFTTGGFKTTQALLAAVVGYPTHSAELFDAIFTGEVRDHGGLTPFFAQRAGGDSRWDDFSTLLSTHLHAADWQTLPMTARTAARYSFETGRVLRPSRSSSAAPKGNAARSSGALELKPRA